MVSSAIRRSSDGTPGTTAKAGDLPVGHAFMPGVYSSGAMRDQPGEGNLLVLYRTAPTP